VSAPPKHRKKRRSVCRWYLGLPLLLLLGLLLLAVTGIPGSWLTPFIKSEYLISSSKIQVMPGRGIIAHNVKIFSPRDLVSPLVLASEVRIKPDWFHRVRKKEWIGEIELQHATLETHLGVWADDLKTDQMLLIDQIQAELFYTEESLRIVHVEGVLGTIGINLEGELSIASSNLEAPENPIVLPRIARNIAKVVSFLEGFEFDQSPEVSIQIEKNSSVKKTGVQFSVHHIGAGNHHGFIFDALSVEAQYEEGFLEIEEFELRENEDRFLRGDGQVDFEKGVYVLRLENSLRRFGLEALCPFPLGNVLDRLQIRLEDRCDFTLTIGPNHFDKPMNSLSGDFYIENGFYRDSFFQTLSFSLFFKGDEVKFSNIEGLVGQGKGQGNIEGDVHLDFKTGFIDVDIKGDFYPDLGISMVGSFAERLIREWEFTEEPPVFSASVYRELKGSPFSVSLDAKGESLLWRGTSFDFLSTKVRYEDTVLSIMDIQAARGIERIEGDLTFLPNFKGCTFTISSTFHFPDMIALTDSKATKWIEPFRFRGTSNIEAEGHLDLSGETQNDIQLTFSFDDIAYKWLAFSSFKGSLRLDGATLELPDLNAKLGKGGFMANFRSEKTFSEQGTFALSLNVDELDLYELLTKALDVEDTPYQGKMNLDLKMTGSLKEDETASRASTLSGGGRLEIKEGTLFKIPLLLGLSRILSAVVNGFGYASQSNLTSDFTIQDGYIRSDKLFLQGNVLSIAGPGSYEFDGRKISADLKIQLFKEGIISDALKLILWPIRKLIEVQLTGTIDDPSWQPKNLPKEIFGK